MSAFFQAIDDVGDDGVASVPKSEDIPAELERQVAQISADRALAS
jgi:hypothetical protein